MKNTFLKFATAIAFLSISAACNSSIDNPAENDTTITESVNTPVSQDEQILADDSATVQTAVGVKDEEANAQAQLKADEKKLMKDEQKKSQNTNKK